MITRNTRRGIIGLIVLTTVSFWINRLQEGSTMEPVADLNPELNYVLHDFELQFFDENGRPSMNLQAPIFRNDPKLELGTIENPVMRLNQDAIVWDLAADTATVTADKEHVQLLGRVQVLRYEPETGLKITLESQEIRIEVTPQTASTDQAVSISDGFSRVDAIGLDLDLKSNTFSLKEQVKATYAVN